MRPTSLLPMLALSACGLTARGLGAIDGGPTDDANDGGDAGADGEAEGGADAAADVVEEADAGPCVVEVNDPFATTTFDPARWNVTANAANAGFPAPVFTGPTSQAKLLDDQADFARGAIWHTAVVPLEAFDISFDAYAVCNSGSCGDGLAVVWLETATTTQLADAGEGSTFGIPNALSGGAVALDLAKNDPLGETAEPAMTILDVDGTKMPGTYTWVVATSANMNALKNDGARRIDVSMRQKNVKVRVDGTEVASGLVPHLPSAGVFGFTAASGSYNAQLAVGDVRAKLYRCNAP